MRLCKAQVTLFTGVYLKDSTQVRNAAISAAKIYAEIIRRQAFEDAREGKFRAEELGFWKRAVDKRYA